MPINIVFSGNSNDFFMDAFGNAEPQTLTPTQITTLDLDTGFTATITGTNFQAGATPDDDPTGTMTGFSVFDASTNPVISITGVNWDLTTFIAAIEDENENNGDGDVILGLLNQDSIVFTAAGSNVGAEFLFDGVTQPITITGSANADRLGGGDGNDVIDPGSAPAFDGDAVYGSPGDDTINLGNVPANAFAMLTYELLSGPATFNVNGTTNTMTVGKGVLGTDTVTSVNNALLQDGLNIWGSESGDTFNLTAGAGAFLQAWGMAGNDTFNLTLSENSGTRISYTGGFEGGPSQGVVADLSMGTVSNDGFGNTDTINILGGTGGFQFRATDNNDSILGSTRDEQFILEQGFDTLDGGGGFDTLRYDRSGVTAINVDLGLGQVTGNWDGNGFLHSISNIAAIRGSRDDGDYMGGDVFDNFFFGRGGDDVLDGFGGNDWLRGEDGNDTLNGGDGTDRLIGNMGDDFLNPGDNTDFDNVDAGSGNDTIEAGDMVSGYLNVWHESLASAGIGQQITISAIGDSTFNKGANGTTTLQNASSAMTANGLGIRGSSSNDTFDLTVSDGGWLMAHGGRGDDTFSLNAANGRVVLAFDEDGNFDAATQGVQLNLGTGSVSNDGFGGTDTITGGSSVSLEVRGSAQADSLVGSSGEDRFDMRRGGNDTIDGGAGDDLIRYHRLDNAVEVDLLAGTATATGSTAFSQVLSNIEAVDGSAFDDRILGDFNANDFEARGGDDALHGDRFDIGAMFDVSAQVYRLYDALLGRTADYGGHAGWTQRIVEGVRSLEEVASGFVNSTEFQNVYGGVTNTEFVTLLFQNVLGRDPGPGAQGFITGLDNMTLTREEVALEFSETQEFVNSTAAAARAFIDAGANALWVDDVYRLYQATLDRDPDLGGLTGWITQLGAAREFQSVVSGFVGSTEFQNLYGATTDEQFVTLLYNNVLGREPSPSEVQGWLDLIAGGRSREEVVTGFSQSLEFQNATADPLETFVRGLGEHDALNGGAGTNVLVGGALSDTFIFEQSDAGTNTVVDMEAWDTLAFYDFGYASADDVRAQMTQVDADVVFADQGTTVTIENITLAEITDDMIQL